MSYEKEPLIRGRATASEDQRWEGFRSHWGHRRQDGIAPLRAAAQQALLPLDDLPASARHELDSIFHEKDPEFFSESLLAWAQRQEQADRPKAAATIYTFLASPPAIPASIQQRARQRLAALHGQGNFGESAESFFRRWGKSDSPVMWAGMALGTGLFAGARAAFLSRLLSRPGSLLARGLTADILASVGAFALETPAVWAATKGLTGLIHPGSQAWDAETNFRELTGLALGLAPMKLIGGASSAFLKKPLPGLVREPAMLAGVVAGQRLNEWAWDQAPVSASRALADGLTMLLDARVGAHLMRGALPGLHRASQEWGLRARASKPGEGNSKNFASATPSLSVALSAPGHLASTVRISRSSGELPQRPADSLVSMASLEESGGSAPSRESVPPPSSGGNKVLIYHGDHLPERSGGKSDPFEKIPDGIAFPADILTRAINQAAHNKILAEIGFPESELVSSPPTVDTLVGIGGGEFGAALGRALRTGIEELFRPGLAIYQGKVVTDLPGPLQKLCRTIDELYGILEYSYRAGQREVVAAAENALGAESLGQLPTLREGLLNLLGPFFGSASLSPQQAVIARGNGETTSLLFFVRHLIVPGGLSWRTPLIVTGRNPAFAETWNATGNAAGELKALGAKLGPNQPINFRHDPPIVFVGPEGYRGISQRLVWNSACLQLLNVTSDSLHTILTPEYIEDLPPNAILFQVIKGIIGSKRGKFAPHVGEQPSLLPYELINLALHKFSRPDVSVASGGGYIPSNYIWEGRHVRMVIASSEDPPRSYHTPIADKTAEALAGPSKKNPYVTITTTHHQHSTELGGAMKNLLAVESGTKAVAYGLAAVRSGSIPEAEQLERDLEFSIIRPALRTLEQALIQDGIPPSKAEVRPEVREDIEHCLGISLKAACELASALSDPEVPVHIVNQFYEWVERMILNRKEEFGLEVRRNTLIGAVVGVLLAVNETRGANIDIRAFLERIPWTKEGVDSLGPVVEKNNYPGHKIEHRRHPDAIYQLFRMIHPSDDLNQPPEIRDPLLSALQKGHPLLNESELRHALEGQDQLVVDLLTREIRRLETRRAEAEAHPEPGYRDAVLRQEQLLPRLLRAMSFGKPTHILDFPFYIQPYQNAVRILLSHQPGREGPNNYSYIQMDGPGAMDRLTQLGLLFRSLGDSARLVMDAEASGLEAREDSPKLWELRHTAREIVNAFLSDHPGRRIQLRVNGEEIEPGALASRGSFQSEKYAAELAPLLAVLNSSGGPEITADTVRTARVRTYELMTRFITREEGWPMLLGYFGGPMQRMIKGGLPRPEKPTPIGIYSGGKLVEGFMVYRGRDDQPMVVNHGLLSDFKRAFPAEYGKITSVEYFNGLPLTSFLETYSRYAAQQGMGNLTYRLIPLRSLPLENALVGKVEGVNPAVLRVFLGKLEGMGPDVLGFIESNFSAHRKQMLAEVDPLYEVEWSEARGAVREIIPRYLAPFEKALGEPLRQNRLVRTFAEHGENAFRLLIRRQRDEVDTAQ